MNACRRFTALTSLALGAAPLHAQCPDLDLRFVAPRAQAIRSLTLFDAGSGLQLFAGADSPGLSAWVGERWQTVSGTEASPVRALLVHDFGSGPELVVAGDFVEIGGVSATRVARWNGTTWSALGAGLGVGFGSYVYALAAFDFGAGARVVATGAFANSGSTSVANLALFDGGAWQPLGAGLDGDGYALVTIDFGNGSELVVGGQFQHADGVPAMNLARWNGSTWSALGSGADDLVAALCVLGAPGSQALIAGGNFIHAGGTPASLIARFDGANWSSLGLGLPPNSTSNAGVGALIPDGAGFIVGGRFEAPTSPASANVARWDGSAWQPFASGLGVPTYVGVEALARFDPQDGGGARIFAAGSFAPQPGQPRVIAQWNGTSWNGLRDDGALGLTHQPSDSGALGAAMWQGDLVVVGRFDAAGSTATATNIARFDGTSWNTLGVSPASTYIDHPQVVRVVDLGAGPELVIGMSRYFTHDARVPVYRWNGVDWLPFVPGTVAPQTDVRVYDVATFDDGNGVKLYAAGYGLSAQVGSVVDTVVRWDGANWSRLDNAPTATLGGIVSRLFVFDDGTGSALYAGGSFAGGVLRWNGASWSAVGAGFGASGAGSSNVADFEVFDDGSGAQLYAGGFMQSSGGTAVNGLARWSGTAWSAVPNWNAPPVGVLTLDVFDDGSGAGRRLLAMKGNDELVASNGGAWTTIAFTDPYFTFARAFADEALPGGGGVVILGNFRDVFQPGEPLQPQTGITILRGCPRVSSFCAGDGLDNQLGVVCPCANDGSNGRGCGWSTSGVGARGARLSSSGSPLTNDIALVADSMTTSGSALFFQGTANAAGAVFGDGLRCASSPTVRLCTRQNVAGGAQVPVAGEPTLSSLGGTTPGSGVVRAYQVWFRVSASFCTSAAFNTTNALRVHW